MRRALFVLCLFASLVTGEVYAGAGTTAANFLKLPFGARSSALGSSFTAFAEGPEALYHNPAGLANGVFNEGRAVFSKWIQGTYFGQAAYRHGLDSGGFGAGITYFNSGEITRRDLGRRKTGSYSFQSAAIDAGQGLRVSESLNLGLALRFIWESVDGEQVNALAGGMGAQYTRQLSEAHLLRAGVSLENLGTEMGHDGKYPLPAVLRVGVGDILFDGLLSASTSINYYFNEENFSGGVGVEYSPVELLDLRAGYRFGEGSPTPYGFTAGIGIRYVDDMEYVFDISSGYMGDLGFTVMAGTGVAF